MSSMLCTVTYRNFESNPNLYTNETLFCTGPILSQIGSQMIYSEMEKLKPFAGDDDDEDENSDVVHLTEKTFESYVSENSSKFIDLKS